MASTTAARLLLVAVLVTAVAVAAGAWSGSETRNPPLVAGAVGSGLTAPTSEVRAAAVLRAWDDARSEAWAAGDVRRLGALYTPGSPAGRRDAEMLRAWLQRGLVVRNLRLQLLALREVRRSGRSWVLQVTDRVSGGSAAGRGASRPLPRDSATTTTVTLRRMGGRWLVESVRAS